MCDPCVRIWLYVCNFSLCETDIVNVSATVLVINLEYHSLQQGRIHGKNWILHKVDRYTGKYVTIYDLH